MTKRLKEDLQKLGDWKTSTPAQPEPEIKNREEFEKWVKWAMSKGLNLEYGEGARHYADDKTHYVLIGYQARQPEIDALMNERTPPAAVDKTENLQGSMVDKMQNLQEEPTQDEPVALIWKRKNWDSWKLGEVADAKELDQDSNYEYKFLYTRSQSDKLRKAAESCLELLEFMKSEGRFETNGESCVIENLRAALEGK